MNASLISPSGRVLVRRVRCGVQPGTDALALPVLVSLAARVDERAVPPGVHPAAHPATSAGRVREVDLAR